MAHTLTDTEIQDRLWAAIADDHTGMLGMTHDSHHFQPMTAFVEEETSTLWFFARKDSDLARAALQGGDAAFIFLDRKLQACIDGRLSCSHDRDRIERFWNAHVAAWYPDGKDDPSLTLLRLDVSEAAVWVTEAGPVKYAIEIASANLRGETPDLGERRDLNFH